MKKRRNPLRRRNIIWCARQDLNLRPPASETVTLSPELRARKQPLYNFTKSAWICQAMNRSLKIINSTHL